MTRTSPPHTAPASGWPTLAEIEEQVCTIASEQLHIPRPDVRPSSQLLEDLHCDSLSLVELLMTIEEQFGVSIGDKSNALCQAVFTRQPFRLSDLCEAIYVQRGSGTPERKSWRHTRPAVPATVAVPFTQLDGTWRPTSEQPLFECISGQSATVWYRRRSDGMRCAVIPAARVTIGCDDNPGAPDQAPQHDVHLDEFLIDAEPVSTTAYCRFLNSVRERRPHVLEDWFRLTDSDRRAEHVLIEYTGTLWRPLAGTETWPMILVSWYGANAYALWANGADWTGWRNDSQSAAGRFLPTEAQWEYAARGAQYQPFPWGDAAPSDSLLRYGRHRVRQAYSAGTLPLAAVNEELGLSPFGLHHMAGNVWQWCRDWYRPDFYRTPDAAAPNAVNTTPTLVRSERGGSWIGPEELCRSSYRRGRPPLARGRCLGFRCISDPRHAAR